MNHRLQPTHPFVHQATLQRLQHQLSVIKKIVVAIAGHSYSLFPEVLLYQLSRFIFHNPLVLKQGLFCLVPDLSLSPTALHLLVEHSQASTHSAERLVQQQAIGQKKGRSAYLSVGRQWKAMRLSQNANYIQILQKGTLFLGFLSNIKIYPLDYKEQSLSTAGNMLDNRKLQLAQRQKSKSYHLISDNLQLTYVYFCQIFKYKKDKKISDNVIKAFTTLMTRHILALKVERNYNTQQFGFEKNYLIVEHQKYIPLTYQRQLALEKEYPALTVEMNRWKLRGENHYQLYREVSYPLSRNQQLLITPKLHHIQQRDVWIKPQTSGYPYLKEQLNQQQQQ